MIGKRRQDINSRSAARRIDEFTAVFVAHRARGVNHGP
jgi:hypothetical protein